MNNNRDPYISFKVTICTDFLLVKFCIAAHGRLEIIMKRALLRELRCLGDISGKLIGICFCTAGAGILTWLTCDGISLAWKLSRLPPCSLPMILMFIMWLALYGLFGALICMCSHSGMLCGDRCTFRSLVAYIMTLFWCPLLFLAGTGLIAACALVLSLLYLISVFTAMSGTSLLISLTVIIIGGCEIYFLYFTVGFMILN
ncbi:MAG: hypothetical protein HFE30_08085 [Clostridiales bacterium]|nr:hypothetical protein [Clostridiales bacterium]